MSKLCEIIRDLLPLYVDGVCSELSAKMINKHLQECKECKAIYLRMCSHTNEDILKIDQESVITHHERRTNARILKYIFIALALLYVPVVLIHAAFLPYDYSFVAFFYFLATMAGYFTFLELGRLVFELFGKRQLTIRDRFFIATGAILSFVTIFTYIYAKVVNGIGSKVLICLEIAFVLNWLVGVIVCKRRPKLKSILTDKTFWLCFAIIILIFALIVASSLLYEPEKEPTEECTITFIAHGSEHEDIYFDVMVGRKGAHYIGVDPQIRVLELKIKNTSDRYVVCEKEFQIYRKIDGKWELWPKEGGTALGDVVPIKPESSRMLIYPCNGYDFYEDGVYKLVSTAEGKAIWVEFEVKTEFHQSSR